MYFSRDRLVFRTALRFALDLIDVYMKKNDWHSLIKEIKSIIEKQDEEIDAIIISAFIK